MNPQDKEQLVKSLTKFTADPEWYIVENVLMSYIEPLKSVSSIDTKLSNDQIASEVRGRQIAIDGLTKFLDDMKIVNKKITNVTPSFK